MTYLSVGIYAKQKKETSYIINGTTFVTLISKVPHQTQEKSYLKL